MARSVGGAAAVVGMAGGWAAPLPQAAPVEGVRASLRTGDFAAAEQVARRWVGAEPANLRATFYVGLALHKQKRHAEALTFLERADAAPDAAFAESPHVPHYLGWCRYYLGDLAGARAAFEQHAAAFPDYDDTQFALGLIAFDRDEVDEAERRFRRALELLQRAGGDAAPATARERAKCLARLGDVALRRGDLDAAERDARAAVALWPDHHEGWAKLARVLDRQGKAAEAAAARAQQQAALARIAAAPGRAAP
ncbi:MAG: tetratricopeptide repeat protein [Phycisphaerales bacterium]|nr:tetratricopeptide repeat protein [Phycisphaerales bacterium]